MKKQYCIDSSAFIQARHIRYPYKNFSIVWHKFAELIKNKTFLVPKHVYDEIVAGGDEISIWIKSLSKFIEPVDSVLIEEMARIVNMYPLIDPNETRESADPYVVAFSKIKNIPCVNEEKLCGENKAIWKIPLVCQKETIRSMTLVEVIVELELEFNK